MCLAVGALALVDGCVPRALERGGFACASDVDCVAGWVCIDAECTPAQTDTGAADGDSTPSDADGADALPADGDADGSDADGSDADGSDADGSDADGSDADGSDADMLPCGDGRVDAGEGCDDGNQASDDGCSPTCTLEAGWYCEQTAPSDCRRPIYVSQSAPGPVHDGTSWQQAYTDLWSTLATQSPAGSVVLVAQGTYQGRNAAGVAQSFALPAGVHVLGGFFGVGEARDWRTAVTRLSLDLGASERASVVTATQSDVRLDGVWVSGGNAANGGGVRLEAFADAVVARCVIENNTATAGGGVQVDALAVLTLIDAELRQNEATTGGAINVLGTLVAARVRATDNAGPQGIVTAGGNAVVDLVDVLLADNTSSSGALVASSLASIALTNGTLVDAAASRLVAAPFLTNVTIVNSILWSAAASVVSGEPQLSHSCVAGGDTQNGNIASDPLLAADYTLQSGSPAIDAGSKASLPRDRCDLDLDGDRIESVPLDLAGAPRVLGADEVDMGAFEAP